jgi:hypothetical protein
MKKPAANKPSGTGTRVSKVADAPEPLDFTRLREKIKETVGLEALGMVEASIAAVKDGQYAALKYLFEMVGLFPAEGQDGPAPADSLASVLLKRMELPEIPASGPEVTKESTQGPRLA